MEKTGGFVLPFVFGRVFLYLLLVLMMYTGFSLQPTMVELSSSDALVLVGVAGAGACSAGGSCCFSGVAGTTSFLFCSDMVFMFFGLLKLCAFEITKLRNSDVWSK